MTVFGLERGMFGDSCFDLSAGGMVFVPPGKSGGIPALTMYTAKSVVFDFAGNWGDIYSMAVVRIEFYDFENKIYIPGTGYTASATSEGGSTTYAKYAFDTSKDKTGGMYKSAWVSQNYLITNQRLIIRFSVPRSFTSIVVNNAHSLGGELDKGVKLSKIYVSPESVTDTTYGAPVPDGTLIFDGEFRQHIAEDVVDNQILELI